MVYRQMAYVYDALMENAPYDKWLTVTETLFKRAKNPIQSVLDIGCGTGQMTLRLAEAGYQTVGVDVSEEMLTFAESRAHEKQLQVQWIHQDVQQLEGLSAFDAAISYCDVMNYITSEKGLESAFHNVYNSLKKDGVFIFDVHATAHVHHNLTNQTFAAVTDDMSYIWFCDSGEKADEMYHDLTFFIRDGNDKFERFSEEHHQRTFSAETYVELIKKAGFKNCKVFADFNINEDFDEGSAERIFFFAVK